jgi:hypothetical protein
MSKTVNLREKVLGNSGGIVLERTNNSERYYFHNFGSKKVDGEELVNTIVYCGDSHAKHYYESKSLDGVPQYVLDYIKESEYTLVDGVKAGWENWGGRPEFSEAFHDFTEAKIVLQ